MAGARLIGRIALGAGTLVAATGAMAMTIGSVLSKANPALAVAWSPYNAEANANLAVRIYSEDPLHPLRRGIAQAAQKALKRSPSNVPAVSMLGVQADARKQKALADRLFAQADRMSRHDTITQMYLIEAAVARGDIRTGLRHYDAALSTSRISTDILEPVLVTASADPTIARPLAALLSRRPIWWADFVRRLVHTEADPGASFPILLHALRLNPGDPAERGLLSAAIGRLVDAGHGDIAYKIYRQAVPDAPAMPLAVRNGSFETEVGFPPFEWELRDAEGVNGSIQPRGRGRALFVSVDNGIDAEVASQHLLLVPGRYVLSAQIGSEDHSGGETSVTISCTGADKHALATLRAPAGSSARLWRATFTVPTTCTIQRLSILGSSTEQSGGQSWVDTIAVTPAG